MMDILVRTSDYDHALMPVAWYQARMVMSYKYDPETFTRRMKTIYDLLMSGF